MIEELESTEVGVDGVPSMNLEEDKDNERKLKEERLIESMEDQLYKVRSVNSSPSKQPSPTEAKKSSIPSPLSSPSKHNSKRERDEENHRTEQGVSSTSTSTTGQVTGGASERETTSSVHLSKQHAGRPPEVSPLFYGRLFAL